jgi:uncharacterized OB-fold protein
MRPGITRDNEFFWLGLQEHRLLAQRCEQCGELRHPPGPGCPLCHSLDWDVVELSGRGTLFSWVVQHHPPAAGFDGPALIAVVELEEGLRLVSNADADPATLAIDEPLEVFFLDQEEGWTVHQFRRPG